MLFDAHNTPEKSGPPVGEPTAARAGSLQRILVVLLGMIAVAAAIAFPFAPVVEEPAEFSWPAGPVPALMPYQPLELTVKAECSAARRLGEGTLLATVPQVTDPAAEPLPGLRISVAGENVHVGLTGPSHGAGQPATERRASLRGQPDPAGALRLDRQDLGSVGLPVGDCVIEVRSDANATTVLVDGAPVISREGDLRPAVTGIFTDATSPAGLGVHVVADTRFQTTISPPKAALAVAGLLALAGMLVVVARGERARRVRLLPRRWWRPGGADLTVSAVLALWWIVGPLTVDDGYIAGIVRSRVENGYIGNVYRWFNAPEAPFSWFYDLYVGWTALQTSTMWMRLPSILLGVLCWLLLSRLLLPRLLPRLWGRSWLGALTFLAWWLPFQLGLRPEPWVALGLLAVVVAVERAVATRRLFPLVVALLVAGATTALTPGGLMAFVPVLVAAVPLLRLLRGSPLGLWVIVPLLAAPAAAIFLMAYDQSLPGLLEAVRVRSEIGGGQPWFEEFTRYAMLLDTDDQQGNLAKRAPVLLTILAAVAALWAVSRRGSGLPAGPVRRVTASFLLSLAVMTVSPTKWTQHFGDVAALGAAVLAVGIVAGSAVTLRRRSTSVAPWLAGLAALTGVGSLILAGRNAWPYVSNWWGLTWNDVTPPLFGFALATLWAAAGGLLLAVLLGWWAWRRSGRRADAGAARGPRAPSPAVIGVLLLVGAVALPVASFTRTSLTHRDDYTLAGDALATLRGRPCGLGERLGIETDPAAGVLPEAGTPGTRTAGEPLLPLQPMNIGGFELPGIVAGSGHTEWFTLDPAQRNRSLPVVVTVAGTLRPDDVLVAEFGDASGHVVGSAALAAGSDTPTDRRFQAPAGATQVRLVASGPGTVRASLPRVPRLTPMTTLLPKGTVAILDWPVAFVFPCLTPAPLPSGTAPTPRWRIGPPQADEAAGITYAPAFGGPFAGPRLLVREYRMPAYLDTDPLRDAGQIYRWEPSAATSAAEGLAGEDRHAVNARSGSPDRWTAE